jgi:hypothetical protein
MTTSNFKNQGIFSLIFLFVISISGFSQTQKSTVREYDQVYTTYPYSDPSPVPVLTQIYPYFRYDGYTDKPVQKSWKVVELENDYIKVIILPEVGGKIWTAIEKSTNQPFIYYNHAVKFRDIAMRGPYTSGGLELNYGIIGHTPNCATPVDYIIRNNEDGSVSCIVGVLDLLTRSNWRLEIKLPKDKAFFETRTFWYSSTPVTQPYYHWLNGGFKSDGNLEFIFPGTHYVGHGGEYADWPINETNGKNISFYNNNDFGGYKSYHVLGKYADFSGGYWHDDDFGVVRFGTHDDKAGKKIWIWGLSRQGMIWENLLTDTDGQYVEMQSGRLFNQNSGRSTFTPFKQLSFAPYATDIWTEYFYPVLNTRGYVEANEYGALNVKNENGYLKIYFSPIQNIDDQIVISEGQKTIYKKMIKASPLKTFKDSIEFRGNALDIKITLGENKLVYNSDPKTNVLSRPLQSPADFNWDSAYGLYIQGIEFMDQKRYPAAEEKLKASLQKDQNYLPAILKMAELNYRNMNYPGALEMAKRALSIDTHDGATNYYYGLINAASGNIIDAKDGFDLATLSSEYRSAAYTELARIYLKEKNFGKALGYSRRAIDYNRFNIEALQLQAVILRNMNDPSGNGKVLGDILSYDPLNHFSRFEQYLQKNNEDSKLSFTSMIRNELPHETYMELAVWYYNSGCPAEAGKVLALSPVTPETEYWKSFLQHKPVSLSGINPDFIFPFRSETGVILEQLIKNQDDWLMKYHLALIYKDRNRTDDCIKLLTSCGDTPDYAPFYATRAEILKGKDDSRCEADLKKALSLDKQWRYHVLLANFYNNHQKYDKALEITAPYYKANTQNFVIGSLHAQTLLLNRKFREADAVLQKINILPHEGATNGREMYREVKLMQAAQLMGKKNYKSALKFISEARLWPENLGVGMPYEEDLDVRLEDWMNYLCNQRLNRAAEADKILNRIVGFKPRIDNSVRNFVPANTLVSAWAFDKLNRRSEAERFIEQQMREFPDYKLISWSKAVFGDDKSFILPASGKDANVRIIEELTSFGM